MNATAGHQDGPGGIDQRAAPADPGARASSRRRPLARDIRQEQEAAPLSHHGCRSLPLAAPRPRIKLRRPQACSAFARTDWDGDGRCSRGWREDLEGDAGRPSDDDAAREASEARPAHRQPYLAPRSRYKHLA